MGVLVFTVVPGLLLKSCVCQSPERIRQANHQAFVFALPSENRPGHPFTPKGRFAGLARRRFRTSHPFSGFLIMLVDWPAHSVGSGFPFQRASTEHHAEVACPRAAHRALTGSLTRCSISLLSWAVAILSGSTSSSIFNDWSLSQSLR